MRDEIGSKKRRSSKQGAEKTQQLKMVGSVADPGCLSRIPDPDFYPSRIPDPKTTAKERGEKKFCCHTFFVATNFT
jgi:hypothetical protein